MKYITYKSKLLEFKKTSTTENIDQKLLLQARRKAADTFIPMDFIRKQHIEYLDFDVIAKVCHWELRCPRCHRSDQIQGNGKIFIKDLRFRSERFICNNCKHTFAMSSLGWAYAKDSNTPELIFPVHGSKGDWDQWRVFLSEYLKARKDAKVSMKYGMIKRVNTATGASRKLVSQRIDTFWQCIEWLCKTGLDEHDYLHSPRSFMSTLDPDQDVDALLWILYFYSYGTYDREKRELEIETSSQKTT